MKPEKKTRNIGIQGMKPPKEICTDKNCPFHGKLGVRGRIITGTVVSDKMDKSIKIIWERIVKIPKYERYDKRKSGVIAHNPPCINAKKGDIVHVMECRPLSKTKKFVVIQKCVEKERSAVQ